MRHRNLIILHDRRAHGDRDFREIAKRVRTLAPDIHAFVLSEPRRRMRPFLAQFLRPTLFVQIFPVQHLPMLRGFVAGPLGSGKIRSYRLLEAAGLPVPRWVEITPETKLDPAEWGNYVIVKPDRGRRGAFIWPVKTRRVRYKPPESYPEGHYGRAGPMLAQRFIFTGPYPVSYRVLTCFGEPLLSIRYRAGQGQAPLSGPDGFSEGLRPVVASTRKAEVSLCFDADILALARRIHEVHPDQPVVGCDVMRDARTGELWIAEVNMVHIWSLSSVSGVAMQAAWGLDFHGQFDAFGQAAEAMIRATRRLAR
jgi:hypothetical protein